MRRGYPFLDEVYEDYDEETTTPPPTTTTTTEPPPEPCGFLCPGGAGLCIDPSLICNGVQNCPNVSALVTMAAAGNVPASDFPPPEAFSASMAPGGDEDPVACARPSALTISALSMACALASAAAIAALVGMLACRACRRDPLEDEPLGMQF